MKISQTTVLATCIYTHLRYRYVVKMVHDHYIKKQLGGASLQLLAAYLLQNLFGIPIPAKYKVTESIT